jgi:hypothetical protein
LSLFLPSPLCLLDIFIVTIVAPIPAISFFLFTFDFFCFHSLSSNIPVVGASGSLIATRISACRLQCFCCSTLTSIFSFCCSRCSGVVILDRITGLLVANPGASRCWPYQGTLESRGPPLMGIVVLPLLLLLSSLLPSSPHPPSSRSSSSATSLPPPPLASAILFHQVGSFLDGRFFMDVVTSLLRPFWYTSL